MSLPKAPSRNVIMYAVGLGAIFCATYYGWDQKIQWANPYWFICAITLLFGLLSISRAIIKLESPSRPAARAMALTMFMGLTILAALINLSAKTVPAVSLLVGFLFLLLVWAWFDPRSNDDVVVTHLHGRSASLRALAFYALPALLVAVPVGSLMLIAKNEMLNSRSPHPYTSNSARVEFAAKFFGKAPANPYWRESINVSYPLDEASWNTSFDMQATSGKWGPTTPPTSNQTSYTYMLSDLENPSYPDVYLLSLDGTYFHSNPKPSRNSLGYKQYFKAFEPSERPRFVSPPPGPVHEKLSFPMLSAANPKTPTTPNLLMPKTFALVQAWKSRGLSDPQLIVAALTYFSQHLAYNYDYQSTDYEKNRVDYFLFTSRKGVCRHFANSFAIMMRMAGIPSRLVSGYQGGVFDPTINTWFGRVRDAHVWVEVWLPKSGWVRVDPTSVVPVEKGIPPANFDMDSLQGSLLRQRMHWGGVFSVAGLAGAPEDHERRSHLPPMLSTIIKYLVLLFAGGMLAAMTWRRRRSTISVDPNERAWQQLCQTLNSRGYAITPSMGPASIGAYVAPTLPQEHHKQWHAVVLAYEQWKFGNHDIRCLASDILAMRRHVPKLDASKPAHTPPQ
jgi:transglutaminase-like putative cysteine protease